VAIVELPRVTCPDDAARGLYPGVIAVSRATALDEVGHADYAMAAADIARLMGPPTDVAGYAAAAVENGEVVGYASIETSDRENLANAEISVVVAPHARGHGVGTALLAWVVDFASARGRTTLVGWAMDTADLDGREVVTAPTGGTFPADNPGLRFATRRGFVLEQVESNSTLHLPVDVAPWLAEAEPHTEGYRLHRFGLALPDEWIDDFAVIRGETTADAPQAGLVADPEVWDAARLRAAWEERAKAGYDGLTVAAEHVASGHLIAFTSLVWREHPPEVAYQGWTFVQREHRGHRLGLWIKAAALVELAERQPTVRRIHTENASENAPMLAINQKMGYRLDSLSAVFQRKG